MKKLLEEPIRVISLDTLIEQDEESVPTEFIENEKVVSSQELASRNIFKENLEKFFTESLTHREERIIKLRFGLEDGIDHTLQEIATEMDLSRERIRQIIEKTLERLRKLGVFKEEL